MAKLEDRYYRSWHKKDIDTYEVSYRQTNLWIKTQGVFKKEVLEEVIKSHQEIMGYASRISNFLHSLLPLPYDPLAPPMVRKMLKASEKAGVGPMASVAGAIAERVGQRLLRCKSSEVVVENGGDCFLYSNDDLVVGIYGTFSSILGKPLMVKLRSDQMPLCVCTSSSQIGHSLSFGRADVATVFARDGALADALATAFANALRKAEDIEPLLREKFSEEVIGVVVAVDNVLGIKGDLELVY